MKVTSILLIFLALALAACVAIDGADTSNFEIDPNEIPIDDGKAKIVPEGVEAVGLKYDPIAVRDMIESFMLSSDDEQAAIANDLVSIGQQVIPHLVRAQQRTKDSDMLMRLMRITSRIEGANAKRDPSGKEPEGNPEEVIKDPGKDPSSENGDLPPSAKDTVKAAEDLVDIGFDQAEVDAFIYNRFNTAQKAFDDNHFQRAMDLCEAILTLAPQTRYRKEVLQLMLDAQSGEQSDRRLAGTIAFDRQFARFADSKDGTLARALKLSVFLTNVSRRSITIDFGDGSEGNSSILILDVKLSEESPTDSSTTRGRISLPMAGEKTTLKPGESHRFSLETTDFSGLSPGGGAKQLLSRVSALGRLRPARFIIHQGEDNDRRVFRPILLSTDEVLVLPAGFDVALAESAPVAFIKQKIEKLDLPSLHMAFAFLKSNDHKEALNFLLGDDLRNVGLREREARLSLAARITSRPYSTKVEDWLEWWRDNRFRY